MADDKDWTSVCFDGGRMSAEEAAKRELELATAPDNVHARVLLLGYYFLKREADVKIAVARGSHGDSSSEIQELREEVRRRHCIMRVRLKRSLRACCLRIRQDLLCRIAPPVNRLSGALGGERVLIVARSEFH